MNFQRRRQHEDPEINLIPMIDVLLVILIYLMITTSYSRFAGLEINLPTAQAPVNAAPPQEINVVVLASGEVLVNKVSVGGRAVADIAKSLKNAGAGKTAPLVIISADATATHQRVIDVMQAAQDVGLTHLTFSTQNKQ